VINYKAVNKSAKRRKQSHNSLIEKKTHKIFLSVMTSKETVNHNSTALYVSIGVDMKGAYNSSVMPMVLIYM
jgi:hypothetical protein